MSETVTDYFPILAEIASALKQSGRIDREIDGPAAAKMITTAFEAWLASGQKVKGITASLGGSPTAEIQEPRAVFRAAVRFQGGPLSGRQMPIAVTFGNEPNAPSGLALESLKAGPEGKLDLFTVLPAVLGNRAPKNAGAVDLNAMLTQGLDMALKEQGVRLVAADFRIKGSFLSASLTGEPVGN